MPLYVSLNCSADSVSPPPEAIRDKRKLSFVIASLLSFSGARSYLIAILGRYARQRMLDRLNNK